MKLVHFGNIMFDLELILNKMLGSGEFIVGHKCTRPPGYIMYETDWFFKHNVHF